LNYSAYRSLQWFRRAEDPYIFILGAGKVPGLPQGHAVMAAIDSRTALIDQGSVVLRGAPFRRNGDIYVPLAFFVTRVARAQVRIDCVRVISPAPDGEVLLLDALSFQRHANYLRIKVLGKQAQRIGHEQPPWRAFLGPRRTSRRRGLDRAPASGP